MVAFAEHPTKPGQPHRVEKRDLQAQAFLEQIKRVEKINKKPETKIAILSSAEVNIHFDQAGEPILDLPDQVLSKLDIVTASRHGIDQEKDIEAIKKSLLMAAKHPLVDTIGHPDRYIRLEGGITDQGEPCDPEKYWEAWEEILEEMAKNNKAFEINLNEKSRPADELLRRAAEKGLNFVLNFDAHDFDQYGKESTKTKQKWAKDEATEDDLAQLADYKKERLQAGPGLRAIRLLMNYLRKLEELGIGQSRIINSSRERLLEFLTEERGKQTDNLNNLKEKFENDQP